MKTSIKFQSTSRMSGGAAKLFSLSLFLFTILSSFIVMSCQPASASVSENRTMSSNFYGVILKTNAQVVLSQGDQVSIRIEGNKDNVESIQTTVENGALIIDGTNSIPVTIYVTVDEISLIEVDGSGKIFSKQVINSDMLLLKVSGSGTINVEVRSLSLGMIVKGNGKIYAKGSTGDSYVRVMGNGQVMARNLDTIKPVSEASIESLTGKAKPAIPTKRGVLKTHQ